MKKIVIHSAGGYEKLCLEEHPSLTPLARQVCVQNEASGINYADIAVRWGLYASAKKFVGWPITPGFEFAGTVKSIGAGVIRFKVGDPVFGVTLFNAYASEVVVPEHQLFIRPAAWTPLQCAGFPAVYLTAYHALFQHIRLRKGMRILVHSAAGGVGSALLQLCKIAECEAVGVVGASHKFDYAKECGAVAVIDKSKQDLWKEAERLSPQGYDIVLDANGVSTLKQSYNHLAPTGKLISYGFHTMLPKKGGHVNYLKLAFNYLRSPRFNPIKMTSENKSLITFNLSFLFDRPEFLAEGMTDMLKWIAEGRIKPPRVTAYPVEKVGEAHEKLESAQSIGKLVITF